MLPLPIMYIIYMELYPKISLLAVFRKKSCAAAVSGAVAVVAAVVASLMPITALAGCSGRVSYNVTTLYVDQYFSARNLNNARIAVLPFLTPQGGLVEGAFEPERMVRKLRALRPDLLFVSYLEFEKGFPARFDRRLLPELYDKLYREDILGVRAMDALWESVAQPYVLVYALRGGAVINNLDESVFKHASVVCELWSRDQRAVVWRAACKGVSDDKRMAESGIMAESMRRLAEAIPATAPNYGREAW
jgi:hypothetical protein